ncbi:ADP-ribosylation factor-like protein 6-interacting protein 1 [Elysia marginata]|uniref:ADP-ribosylation factor-like protein 6-interacting protein 1 n=1 Tax=Elysia marginata TaxID=1093978 RepID=A0AAV4GWU9_9GAST|nr:ADP-ribosylation factor-like protein 6-interacting protein 1 [Elysia marginata]
MDYTQRKQLQQAAETVYQGITTEVHVQEMKRDLEGWREVLIPLTSLLRWDKPFYPAVIAGAVTFVFLLIWYTGMSAVTTISLFFLLVGAVDFIVPHLGPKVTGITNWTGAEETEFTDICERIMNIQKNVVDTWLGLSAMRQQNPKLFFFVIMGFLTCTAWIGNLFDNLFLTYLIVTAILLLPGIRHHNIAHKYLQPVVNILSKLRQGAKGDKKKET